MNKSLIVFVFLVLLTASCNLLGNNGIATQESPDAILTQAAQTVVMELTKMAVLASPTPKIPINTFTPIPTNTPISTNTPIPTATNTPIPCNLATWDPATIDVTIPDNTKMAPSQVFSKTWRIRNVGACSWNSNYRLIFDHGNGMGVTNGYTQKLTSGVVNPGQWVDLTVNLKAPSTTGTYSGYWRLRDPGGVIFGITRSGGTFTVKIVVVETASVTLLPIFGKSGSVSSDGVVSTSELSVGDTSSNKGIEIFLSYDISDIPSDATITKVKFDTRNSSMTGDPFKMGVLNLYMQDFGTLDKTDYVSTLPGGGNLADWASASVLNKLEVSPEIMRALHSKLGSSLFQLRLQFVVRTNHDGTDDKLMYGSLPLTKPINNPALLVTYVSP